jgi:hypothetical protein
MYPVGVLIVILFISFNHLIQAADKSNSESFFLINEKDVYYIDDLLVVAVATNETDGYHRLVRSLKIYGYKYEVIFRDL